MSVISSGRVLPCNVDDERQTAYLVIRGAIQNNEKNSITGEWDAPLLGGCPAPIPKKKLGSTFYCPEGYNCEIRLHPVDLTEPPICSPSDPSEAGSRYFLPSLSLLIHNNVNDTQVLVDPYDAKSNLTGSPIKPCSSTFVSCETGEKKRVHLRQDGILSAVYTIGLYNSYKTCLNKPVYEYVICPYTPADVFSLPDACNEASDVYDIKDIMGTQPFCLGTKEQPCVCVSLLLHGALRDDEDPSDTIGCVETDLYWVGVKLYYTNLEGKMCYRNPVCLNIAHAPSSPFSECFTPYFAKTSAFTTSTKPTGVVKPVCNQLSESCNQYETKSMEPKSTYGSLQGKVYLGCGITGDTSSTFCESLQVILVSSKVDITSIIHDTTNCTNYIVLLPNTLLTVA